MKDADQWRAFTNTEINARITQKAGNILSSCATVSLSSKTLFHTGPNFFAWSRKRNKINFELKYIFISRYERRWSSLLRVDSEISSAGNAVIVPRLDPVSLDERWSLHQSGRRFNALRITCRYLHRRGNFVYTCIHPCCISAHSRRGSALAFM